MCEENLVSKSRLLPSPHLKRWVVVGVLAGAMGLMSACGDEAAEPVDPGADNNGGGKTDDTESEFLKGLAEHKDPIGRWLVESSGISPDGTVAIDYVELVLGLASQEGCSVEGVKTFLISDTLLTGGEPFPRTVTVICGDDPAKAAEIFLSAPEGNEEGDISLQILEMFAWDPVIRSYRFYRMDPIEEDDSLVFFDTNPTACRQCHLGSSEMDPTFIPMVPIMNELTLPWPHWMSQPDADDHSFSISEELKEKENYNKLTEIWAGTAPNLEAVIRKGMEKANTARLGARRNKPADPELAMSLLRPLFCNERINFVTENGGTVPTSIFLDDGLISMFGKINGGQWPWAWYNDRKVRIGTPVDQLSEVDMVAVRGAVDVDYEQRLVAGRALTAEQVLQIKALDWKNPVFSGFRCQLWNNANERLRIQPPEFDASGRTSTLMPIFFEEIMTVQATSGARVSLLPPEGYETISLDYADAVTIDALADTIEAGALADAACDAETGEGFCAVSFQGLGDMIDRHIQSAEVDQGLRDKLLRTRSERACIALEFYPNSPDISNVEGCDLGAGE